jgi:hypothetical protein
MLIFSNELSRFAVNAVTSEDYQRPVRLDNLISVKMCLGLVFLVFHTISLFGHPVSDLNPYPNPHTVFFGFIRSIFSIF